MSESKISAFDIAIIDALKSIMEVVVAKGVATHADFAFPFDHQMKSCMQNGNGEGAAVFLMLADWCRSYGAAHTLHAAPAEGSIQ